MNAQKVGELLLTQPARAAMPPEVAAHCPLKLSFHATNAGAALPIRLHTYEYHHGKTVHPDFGLGEPVARIGELLCKRIRCDMDTYTSISAGAIGVTRRVHVGQTLGVGISRRPSEGDSGRCPRIHIRLNRE